MHLLAGCVNSKKNLYFGTYTRIGIDASANNSGIGFKTAAIKVAPPKKNGKSFDVLAQSDVTLSYFDVVVDEVVAVGDPAKCASYLNPAQYAATLRSQQNLNPKNIDAFQIASNTSQFSHGPIIYGASTGWSLIDLSWGGTPGAGINFGYKRTVGIKMPVVDNNIGDAYARIQINSSNDSKTNGTAPISLTNKGTRTINSFATGQAAIIKAANQAQLLNDDAKFKGCL